MKRYVRVAALILSVLLTLSLFSACKRQSDPAALPASVDTPATVTVTIPEGRGVRSIASRLEENGVCSASDFFAACSSVDWKAEFDFLPDADRLSAREYPLEGYLFPDTYDFFVPESAESCVRKLLKNFSRRVTDEMRADCSGGDLCLDDVIILASIVERETDNADEAPKVAKVFRNRLEHPYGYKNVEGSSTGGKFQSDATKFYPYTYTEAVNGEIPDGFESEYNTYNFAGLPKGPICCPSLSSIKASIYPDKETKAVFFYTDKNGKHYYAVSYDEHKANIKYCKDNGLA